MSATSRPAVLVAGGAGFVGSAIVRQLLEANVRTIVLDNFLHGRMSNLDTHEEELTIAPGDACQVDVIEALFDQYAPTHVVSCMGDTFVTDAYDFPERFFQNNLVSNLNLLQVCRRRGVQRVVYASTTEVYGDQPGITLNEGCALAPVNTYAVSKLAADRLFYTFAIEHGVPTVIARLFNCYGPRETHAYVVPEVIEQLSRSDSVSLGNIDATRDFTYVEDTARALIMLLFSSVESGTAVNVGSNVSISIGRLVEIVAREMGRNHFSVNTSFDRLRRRDIAGFRCDHTLLSSLTGWTPTVGITEGIRRTVAWYRANGNSWRWDVQTEDAKQAMRQSDSGVFGSERPRTPTMHSVAG